MSGAEWLTPQQAAAKRRGRPAGEVRRAVADAARRIAQERAQAPILGVDGKPIAGATWPELMAAAKLSWKESATTIKNMVRGRELQPVGRVQVEGYERPLQAYAPAAGLDPHWARGFDAVQQAMQVMCRAHG
jgi:hypothetical protein